MKNFRLLFGFGLLPGKRDDFNKKDLLAVAGQFGIRNAAALAKSITI